MHHKSWAEIHFFEVTLRLLQNRSRWQSVSVGDRSLMRVRVYTRVCVSFPLHSSSALGESLCLASQGLSWRRTSMAVWRTCTTTEWISLTWRRDASRRSTARYAHTYTLTHTHTLMNLPAVESVINLLLLKYNSSDYAETPGQRYSSLPCFLWLVTKLLMNVNLNTANYVALLLANKLIVKL